MHLDRTELETELVGALLRGEVAGQDPMEMFDLDASELRLPDLRAVYRAMQEVHRAGHAVDPLTVSDCDPKLASHMSKLMDGIPVGERSIAGWIVELREDNSRATWTAAYSSASKMLQAGSTLRDVQTYLEAIEDQEGRRLDDAISGKDVLREAYDLIERAMEGNLAVSTGFQSLAGYEPYPGDQVVIGARPSVGKTALGLALQVGIARQADRDVRQGKAKRPAGALFASAEMQLAHLGVRITGGAAGVDTDQLLRGTMVNDAAWSRLARASGELASLPLWYTAATELGRICALAAQLRRREGISALVVDYLQLLDLPAGDTREQEVAKASKRFKQLAKRTGLVTYVLAQLKRPSEKRRGQPPVMDDLRESGALEQDADHVWLLWRPGQEADDREDDRLAVIHAKQRNGPAGGHTYLRFESGQIRDEDPGRY